MDQGMFLTLRALDRNALVQCVWIYEHPVDFEGLKRFHDNLGRGLLGRRIERSPLPFARDRWVTDRGPDQIDVAKIARPRNEVGDWMEERAQLPIDAERGPAWHLGVLPLTDGSTAVTLVASHCLIDGLGIVLALAEAALGKTRDLDYPPPRSRTRWRALAQDARDTARDAPQIGRAIAAAARQARRRRDEAPATTTTPPAPLPVAQADERVVVPAVVVHIDTEHWDARARALGGHSHHLAAGLAAKLGQRSGRRRPDGTVTVQVPLSDRTEDDTRANALSYVSFHVDPTAVTTDLSQTRAAVRKTFETLREAPELASPTQPLAPLVSFVPKRVLREVTDAAFAFDELPVASSSLGDIAAMAAWADGTQAEYAFGRGVIQRVMRQDLERAHGELSCWLLRIGGKICITVAAYRPGGENTKAAVRDLVARTLDEFGLTGVIE